MLMSKSTCQHTHILIQQPAQRPVVNGLQALNQYDPTHTTTLRNAFSRDMNKRFIKLRGLIRKTVVDQDCFGLKRNGIDSVMNNVAGLPGHRAFAFERSADKIEGFMEWLNQAVTDNILTKQPIASSGPGLRRVGRGVEEAWTNMYVRSAYAKGITDARTAMLRERYKPPGGMSVDSTMSAVFESPVHADRIGTIYIRTYSELKGITAQMEQQISRVLAQGMAEQRGPADIARILNKTISGAGGTLDLTDSLGRFIPAQRRAVIIARTEVIRAHHVANVQEMRNWGVEGVSVQAEFRTAGDSRVCELCASMHGNTYTLDQIESMIPVHPQCRCRAFPKPAQIR